MQNFTLVCANGDCVSTTIETLKKIPYFTMLFSQEYKEVKDGIINFDDFNSIACKCIIDFYQSNKIKIPTSSLVIEEALGIAKYWDASEYISRFIRVFHKKYSLEKPVELLNLLFLTGEMDKYKQFLNQRKFIGIASKMPLVYRLLNGTIDKLVDLTSTSNNSHLFPLIREWYLFDPREEKITLVKELIPRINFTRECFAPSHRTSSFLNKFPEVETIREISRALLLLI